MSTDMEAARELRAVILLAGRVGRSPFADGVARSVLDLPVDAERTVRDVWMRQVHAFACDYGLKRVRIIVAVDQAGTLPSVRAGAGLPRIEIEAVRDTAEYRGTAGVVRDLTRDYADRDRILVATANQIQRESLRDVFESLCRGEEGVSIVPHAGGELAGLFLMTCGRLRDVPDAGFIDLKEQAIPSARGQAPLVVARRASGSSLPIRTLDEYIQALRTVHGGAGPDDGADDPYAESWQPVFSIVEPGAYVGPGATLQDAVVLSGGFVEDGAAVARSVVCDGGVVHRGQCIVESIVTE